MLPEDASARVAVDLKCRHLCDLAGYDYVETPIFEDTELFARGVGQSTDIVQKEMFTFEDMGGRSLTLRPEGTAPICRTYIEHGMHKRPQPVKVWYLGPFFRHEAPQAGRFRQFTQVGVEALGSDDPALDAEVIVLLDDLLRLLNVQGIRLRLSSLGTAETRREYAEELKTYLRENASALAPDVQARIDANPLRAFDSGDPGTQEVMKGAPTLLDRLSEDDAAHFSEVRALLAEAGIEYELDATLVRGLDYYTRTVFEFTSDALGAQSGVGGGGRYDGLVEELGGPPTPGIGWAAGIERIVLAAGDHARTFDWMPPLFVAMPKPERKAAAFRLVTALRRKGRAADMEYAGRSLKGQLKQADRLNAQWVVIVEDDGYELKDMKTGEQTPVTEAELMEKFAP